MALSPLPEMLKGISDLPIAALAAVLAFLLPGGRAAREWRALLLMVSVSALFGAAVHVFAVPEQVLSFAWTALYILLFELVYVFCRLILRCIDRKGFRRPRAVRAVQTGLYLASAVCLFAAPGADIYVFVLFAAMLFAVVVFRLLRAEHPPRSVIALLLILLAALLCQGLKSVIPYGVVWGHVFIAAALFVLFFIAKNDCSFSVSP